MHWHGRNQENLPITEDKLGFSELQGNFTKYYNNNHNKLQYYTIFKKPVHRQKVTISYFTVHIRISSKYPCSVNVHYKMQISTVPVLCLHACISNSIGEIYPCILLYFEPQTLLNGRLNNMRSPCSVCFSTHS
jgi:hypothetical protein